MSLKLQTYRVNHRTGQEKGWEFYCPACRQMHRFRTKAAPGKQDDGQPWAVWHFDGVVAKPTFSPSLLYYTTPGRWEGTKWVSTGPRRTLCHLHLRAGVIEYCRDNPHAFNGQKVALLDIPEPYRKEKP